MDWYPRPIRNSMVEILEERGAMSTDELEKKLKEEYEGLTSSELDKELMKLELNGIVTITSLGRGRKRIEYIRRESEVQRRSAQ
jgi:DNA-binding PadR family transcriptional regulator